MRLIINQDLDNLMWKAFTGGLLKATISKVLPLKYVDKLEKKLAKKMDISASKMNRYKNKMQNDANKSRSTQSRNTRLYNEKKVKNASYTKALVGVKTVNDAYKSFGTEALQNIDLFKVISDTKRAIIETGSIDAGYILR